MANETNTASETLFTVERALRHAANEYAVAKNETTRKQLRDAALKYADIANQIDEQVEFQS